MDQNEKPKAMLQDMMQKFGVPDHAMQAEAPAHPFPTLPWPRRPLGRPSGRNANKSPTSGRKSVSKFKGKKAQSWGS